MIHKISKFFQEEYFLPAILRIGFFSYDKLRGKFYSFLLGWPNSYVGLRTKIIGTRAILVHSNVAIGRDSWIEAVFRYGDNSFNPKIIIGRWFSASQGLHISAVGHIEFGENCLIGSNVSIFDHNHGDYQDINSSLPTEPPISRKLVSSGIIKIGSNVWIGDNVVIVGPLSIGSGSIIGANSIVVSDIPEEVIAAGSPARIIKKYNKNKMVWER